MKDFLTLLQNRRSIRKYTEQPVEQEKIDLLCKAALMSPAGKRLNPWEFTVVTDREKLRQMAGCRTYGSQMLEGSPLGIVISVDPTLSDTWPFDAAIAAENIMLQATDLGLGACWVQVYRREGAEDLVKQICGIPASQTVVCIVSIGYKNEDRRPYDFEKLPYNKVHTLQP